MRSLTLGGLICCSVGLACGSGGGGTTATSSAGSNTSSGTTATSSASSSSAGTTSSGTSSGAATGSSSGGTTGGFDGDAGYVATCTDASEGLSCGNDGGTFCNDGVCQSWTVAPHGALPLLESLTDAGVIASPQLISITFDSDPLQQGDNQYLSWLATSSWLSTVGAQYGVGPTATVQDVEIAGPPPSPADPSTPGVAYSNAEVQTFLLDVISDGGLPVPQPNSIYVLFWPGFDYSSFTSGMCVFYGGFHYYFGSAYGPIVYAEIPFCAPIAPYTSDAQEIQIAASHEVLEASTDPQYESYNWPATSIWQGIGGELADMCEYSEVYYTDPATGNQAQTIWSDLAAATGTEPPCQPWPSTQAYFNVSTAPSGTIAVTSGSQVTVTLTGWSLSPHAAWSLSATDSNGHFELPFETNPQLSANTIINGGTVTLTLTIPSGLTVGHEDGILIISHDIAANLDVSATFIELQVH